MLQRGAGGGGGGRGRERVGDVVGAAEGKLDRRAALRRAEAKVGAEAVCADRGAHIGGREVRPLAHAEGHHARRRRAAPQAHELIVRVDDGGRRGGEPCDHLALGARHALERAEALQVLGARVGDQADGRARQGHERRDLAGAVGAHLDDGEAVPGRQAHEGQRHADVVVEVAARGQALPRLRQDRGGHLLRGGLAVAAGDPDERAGKVRAPAARGALERRLRVGDHDLRQRHRLRRAHHGAGGAGLQCRADEVLAVEVRTLQRDEQLPALERARVAHHVGEGGIRPLQAPAAGAREFFQRALHAGSLASSALTTAWSRNSRRSPPTIW